jgi:hypothetical protein
VDIWLFTVGARLLHRAAAAFAGIPAIAGQG